MLTGLGEPCQEPVDCEAFEADYCAMDPTVGEGACTVSNCTIGPDDDCPGATKCCQFPPSIPYPTFCLPEEVWNELNSDIGCEG